MTLQELEQLKQCTLSAQSMDRNRQLPRVTVGMGTCGIKAGAVRVLERLKQELAAVPEVFLTHVGCNGLCSSEPVIEVALPGEPAVIYGNMTPEKAARVAREHIVGGQPVKEWVLPLVTEW